MKKVAIVLAVALVALCVAVVACGLFWRSEARRQLVGCYVLVGYGTAEWKRPCPAPYPVVEPTPHPDLIRTMVGIENWAISLAFSPDGDTLAVAEVGNSHVNLWQVSDDTLVRSFSFDEDNNFANAVAFSPDGQLLAAGSSAAAEVRVWQVSDGALRHTFAGYENGLAISADSTLLAAGYRSENEATNYSVGIWRLDDGSLLRSLPLNIEEDGRGSPRELAFSPDGTLLAFTSGFTSPVVEVWSVADGELLFSSPAAGSLSMVVFSPDGRQLAEGGLDAIRFWHTADWTVAQTLPTSSYGLAFSPDGRTLASRALGQITLWDVASGRELRSFAHDFISAIAYSPDGSLLASATRPTTTTPAAPGTDIVYLWRTNE